MSNCLFLCTCYWAHHGHRLPFFMTMEKKNLLNKIVHTSPLIFSFCKDEVKQLVMD